MCTLQSRLLTIDTTVKYLILCSIHVVSKILLSDLADPLFAVLITVSLSVYQQYLLAQCTHSVIVGPILHLIVVTILNSAMLVDQKSGKMSNFMAPLLDFVKIHFINDE